MTQQRTGDARTSAAVRVRQDGTFYTHAGLGHILNSHSVMRHLPEAVYVCLEDGSGRLLSIAAVNDVLCRELGYEPQELVGQSGLCIVHPDAHHVLREVCHQGEAELPVEVPHVHRDGSVVSFETAVSHFAEDDKQFWVFTCRPYGERIGAVRKLADRPFFDRGTGFPNEHWLHAKLMSLQSQTGTQVSVVAVGLNKFIGLRDSYGDEVMNEVFHQLLMRVQRALPKSYVARVATDEFVVALRTAGIDQTVLSFLTFLVEQPIQVRDFNFRLQARFGVAVHGESEDGTKMAFVELLHQSLLALHTAGEASLNSTWYTPSLKRGMEEKHSLYFRLMEALDKGQIGVVYQPKFDRLGNVVGAEALARWNDPEYPCSPGTFIPIAEELGLIHKLGLRVLGTVCRDLVQNDILAAANIPISVNCSVRQLDHPDFLRNIHTVLGNYGIAPQRIVFEVTESVFADSGRRLSVLQSLQDNGHLLAIDDFGTGYSSFRYFRDLAPDILKIDQSFVRYIGLDPKCEIIVSSIIDLAHHLGAVVVAEGVETDLHGTWLRDRGCDVFQGYLFSRPLHLRDFLQVFTLGSASRK
ncbi:PAS domain S-box-containing protein [Alicyclobacillus sacchari]|uniref:PAS domain S-box-containing protein n=1 Tax=Alicyclobacillus sacchari TaxID=392010 RepID=A0A4V3HEB0_9BACL|nr:EAL domain-containing protein [Alicyclobacillus sacchari]TDY46268.1 PAS domain S-box-containing protein [Alicyclobacillus sacchari]GMA57237.1 hypothetical protein GCM10025858_17400 [Alicyclobacillus sacchari]